VALLQLKAREQASKLRKEEAEEKTEPTPRRARFVFPEQVEEVTQTLEPEEVLANPQAYRALQISRQTMADWVFGRWPRTGCR